MTHETVEPDRWASRRQRIDKWLWCARFFKSRTKAAKLCESGAVRVNRTRINKSSVALKVGDVVTLPLGKHIRVIRILELAERRGPAVEARTLYADLLEDRGGDPVLAGDAGRRTACAKGPLAG